MDDFGDIREILEDLEQIQFLVESPTYKEVSALGSEVEWGVYGGDGFPLIAEPTFAIERAGDDPTKIVSGALENLNRFNNGDSYNANKISERSTHRVFIDLIDNSSITIETKDRLKDTTSGEYYQITYIDSPMDQQKFLEIYLLKDENYGSQSN